MTRQCPEILTFNSCVSEALSKRRNYNVSRHDSPIPFRNIASQPHFGTSPEGLVMVRGGGVMDLDHAKRQEPVMQK
jgi:hypothetical protein